MKINRLINTLALLAALGFTAPTVSAQEAMDPVAAIVQSVAIDNLKTVAGSGAQSIAVQNTALGSAQSQLIQNAISHANRVNVVAERALSQTVVTSATEGSKAVETVQEAGDAANVAQALALLSAFLNSNVNTGGQ